MLEAVLKAQIRNVLGVRSEYQIILHISARSAVLSLFQGLPRSNGAPKVLVQDYICPCVPLAIEKAKMVIVSYPLIENMVPDEEILDDLVRQHLPVAILYSPIFGAQGKAFERQIGKWSEVKERPRIVLDEAQYLERLVSRPDAVVLSFHGKSIDSMNGGALLLLQSSIGNATTRRGIKPNEEFYLTLFFRSLRRRRRRAKVDGYVPPGYSFDDSRYFPEKMEVAKMPLVSIIVAIFQMIRREHYLEVRRYNFKKLSERIEKIPGVRIIRTESVDTAARFPLYVDSDKALEQVARSLAEVGVGMGRPYGRHNDPSSSARPALYSVTNPFYLIEP